MSELKPCPFCGRQVAGITDCGETTCFAAINCFCFDTCVNKTYTVVCNRQSGGCGATGGYHRTESEAIEAWNRRASDGMDQR